jgi:hypothetical protein
VQEAWARIGDADDRRRWDSGQHRTGDREKNGADLSDEAAKPQRAARSTVRARTYGHPGGFARERYLVLVREWAGRGTDLADPYDAALVRSAPREIRHLLADALAEEATARAVSGLGIGYTMWSDVATDHGKLDHVILGPAGLFAVLSEDWGGDVRVVRGELVGEGIPAGEQPVKLLVRLAKSLGRSSRVRITGMLIVVPDEALAEPISYMGRKRDAAAVRLSFLPTVLRDGLDGGQRLSIEDVFDVRSRLQHSIRFV